MGGSSYSGSVYNSTVGSTVKSHGAGAVFVHSSAIKSGRIEAKAHELLDPAQKNKAGKIIRESRDSDAHPESLAIAVLLDVTGSQESVPKQLVSKLDKLMAFLVKKGIVEHPQILWGGIGDASQGWTGHEMCDKVPFQISQFEGGNELDDALSKLYLEGGGGGQLTESYEIGWWFLNEFADMDCLNKRGKKGYLFQTGDELPYPKVSKDQIAALLQPESGKDTALYLKKDVPTEQVLASLREKFEVFWIIPEGTYHCNDPEVVNPLKKMFGQNLLRLDDIDHAVELIASTIAMCEGYDPNDIKDALKDAGSTDTAIISASKALAHYKPSGLVKSATVDGSLEISGTDDITRL